MELKIGNVVRLKSDTRVDVPMTINGYSHDGDNYFICVWFISMELRSGSFHKDALIIWE